MGFSLAISATGFEHSIVVGCFLIGKKRKLTLSVNTVVYLPVIFKSNCYALIIKIQHCIILVGFMGLNAYANPVVTSK
jgi:hypothetical protein